MPPVDLRKWSDPRQPSLDFELLCNTNPFLRPMLESTSDLIWRLLEMALWEHSRIPYSDRTSLLWLLEANILLLQWFWIDFDKQLFRRITEVRNLFKSKILLLQIWINLVDFVEKKKIFYIELSFNWFSKTYDNITFTTKEEEWTILFCSFCDEVKNGNVYICIPEKEREMFLSVIRKILRIWWDTSAINLFFWKKLALFWNLFSIWNIEDNSWIWFSALSGELDSNSVQAKEYILTDDGILVRSWICIEQISFHPSEKDFVRPVQINWKNRWQLVSFSNSFEFEKPWKSLNVSIALNLDDLDIQEWISITEYFKLNWESLPISIGLSGWKIESKFKLGWISHIGDECHRMINIKWTISLSNSDIALLKNEVSSMGEVLFTRQ